MLIAEATEMYLETILILQNKIGHVRAIDISNEMGYARATLSIKLKQLAESKLVDFTKEGGIILTDEGRKIAEKTFERHNLLTMILQGVGVSDITAREDACRIEHYISEETFNCLREHYNKSLTSK